MGRRARTLPIPPGGFQRIAVLRLSSLGDVVLSLAAVRALAQAFPNAHLTYWVKEEYADLVRFDPAVAHVRVLERDSRRFEDVIAMGAELEEADLIVDLHGNLRTRVLTFRQRAPVVRAPSYRLARSLQIHMRWARRPPPPSVLSRQAMALSRIGITHVEPPRAYAGADAEAWASAWLADWGPGPRPVALIPGAAHATKRWPESHWLELHDRLRSQGERLLYFGLEADRQRTPALAAKVAADTSTRWCGERLARAAALLTGCRGAVAGDTGLMHLAAARGVPTVAMFGSTSPALGFAPAGEGHTVLCRQEPCQPCTLHGRDACPKRHFRCMMELRPDQVAAAVESTARGA